MQNRILIQSFILCFVAIYLTLGSDASTQSKIKFKRASSNKSNTVVKVKKITTPKPGFFRTLFSVVYEQYEDTRDTIGTVNKLVNDNFLPENGTVESATAVPGSNVSTTEDNRISRAEFNKIIFRNLRGLRNLYNIEFKEAMKQSEKNYNEFRKNVNKEIGTFL